MRVFTIITCIVAAISLLYRWRYRIVNTLLAIGFLRRIAVAITMNMPTIRKQILPNIFRTNESIS
ncbi:MAG TPA: hypothetical protein VK077_04360 [Virgibacillus sp.]|nr:hypothetical protein [Virgibacillus sp.]